MTVSITLPDDLSDLVEAKVAAGDYSNTDDVIRAALELLDRRERNRAARLLDLRTAIQNGLDSGTPELLDIEAFLEEVNAEFNTSNG